MSARHSRRLAALGPVVAGCWLAVTGFTAAAHPVAAQSAGPADPVAAVLAMTEAYNRGDAVRLRAHVDPSFVGITLNPPPGYPPEYVRYDREGFIQSSVQGARAHATCRRTAVDQAVCATVLTGASLPPTAHPWHSTITFTVANGKITGLQERLSPQTYKELADLGAAQPGMPPTGAAGASAAPALLMLALGLLLLALGAGLRHSRALIHHASRG